MPGAQWFPGTRLNYTEHALRGKADDALALIAGNESGEDASMLILFAPGAPREAYFEGLVELAEGRWKPSHDELQAFFEEHDNIYV